MWLTAPRSIHAMLFLAMTDTNIKRLTDYANCAG
jgi:hypothetical protein